MCCSLAGYIACSSAFRLLPVDRVIDKRRTVVTALAFYIASLITPAVKYKSQLVYGWEMLLQGFAWAFMVAITPSGEGLWILLPWLANFLFLASIFLIAKDHWERPLWLVAISGGLMLCYALEPVAVTNGSGAGWAPVTLHLGYGLWIAAPIVTGLLLWRQQPETEPSPS